LALAPDGGRVLFGARLNKLRNMQTVGFAHSLVSWTQQEPDEVAISAEPLADEPVCMAFAADAQHRPRGLFGCKAGLVGSWDLLERIPPRSFVLTEDRVVGLACSGDGRSAISVGQSYAHLWNAGTGQQIGLRQEVSDKTTFSSACLSSRGHVAAAGCLNNTFVVWKVDPAKGLTGRIPYSSCKKDFSPILTLAFSPDETRLLTG